MLAACSPALPAQLPGARRRGPRRAVLQALPQGGGPVPGAAAPVPRSTRANGPADFLSTCSAARLSSGCAGGCGLMPPSSAESESNLAKPSAPQERASRDYRLNWRLQEACDKDVHRLCPAACGNLARECCCCGSGLCGRLGHLSALCCRSTDAARACLGTQLRVCQPCCPKPRPAFVPSQARRGAAARCCSASASGTATSRGRSARRKWSTSGACAPATSSAGAFWLSS